MTDKEKLESAVALLLRLKGNLMHTRRFVPDTLGSWRMACTQAEGDVEEWLLNNTSQEASAGPHAERAAFEAWAATEWVNGHVPHTAWLGWAGRAGIQAPV